MSQINVSLYLFNSFQIVQDLFKKISSRFNTAIDEIEAQMQSKFCYGDEEDGDVDFQMERDIEIQDNTKGADEG
jgi:hypothetical protein